jgi:electron transfer flavoprotein beta subunit
MNILVCISKVPDTTTKIKFSGDQTQFDENGVQFVLNPYDEWYALVRACELKESQGGSVTVINVGPAANEQIIRKALAIGADKAVRVDADPQDGLYVARQIAAHAQNGSYDMVLLGKETIDYNSSAIGAMIAELLDLPYVSLSSKLDVEGQTATLDRDIEGGKENIRVQMPFVASAQKGMAEARIPNMRGIMQARTKPLEVVAPVDAQAGSQYHQYQLPGEKTAVKLIDPENMEELVRLLHEEAKVL